MPSINIERFAKKLPIGGEKRLEIARFFGAGAIVYTDTDKWRLDVPVTMNVTWIYNQGDWHIHEKHWDTMQPVLTRWQRFKAWLSRKPALPMAKVVSE